MVLPTKGSPMMPICIKRNHLSNSMVGDLGGKSIAGARLSSLDLARAWLQREFLPSEGALLRGEAPHPRLREFPLGFKLSLGRSGKMPDLFALSPCGLTLAQRGAYYSRCCG